ncbi:MAG TPA: alanine--tRNA ligase [Mycobacteriales bacterium]|jgi:alanyl-tRNA synthetase|nr:alanine--tRNA ligase [Mycobacteriales bacterium]
MKTVDITGRFTRFFQERGHTVVPSASLIADDPTLLLVNAGMVPFKPYFLGQEPAPYPRATSIQKVVRTVDIDIVGTNSRNVSFFQMAGNFSFGDYFKEGAIPFAWELLTRSTGDGGFGFDESRLWPTVYLDDDEAYRIWTKDVGVPESRVQRRDRADNFWSMGVAGPCGPCSEIYFDRGPGYGREGGPIADEERYLEVWNLVFMQYVRGDGEGYDYVDDLQGELPKRNIDTGMGVDRMAVLMQGVEDIFDTDLLRPLLDWTSELAGTAYHVAEESDLRLRVVADHARTTTMLISDGVVPGNEGRGYVLRRMLRRTVRTLRLLGVDRPVMSELTGLTCGVLSPSFPALAESADRIQAIAAQEEDMFLSTLRTGSALFERLTTDVRSAGGTTVPGDAAFLLHDTHGFPIDLVIEMAREQGMTVDEPEFRRLMGEQRERAKRDSAERKSGGHADLSVYRGLLESAGPTDFTGYDTVESEGRLAGLLVDGVAATSAGEGADVEIVLDRTPFYAEGGGQLADHGLLRLADGSIVEVYDAQRPIGDLTVHRGRVVSGEVTVGAALQGVVDVVRRGAVSRAHTATHLVHQAIRRALGDQASQAGSQNDAGRFRFDFASPSAVPDSVLADIEAEVNDVLLADLDVHAFITSQEEAKRIGAIAMFGEKYGDRVRVVEVGDYSRELCGGTHAHRSSQLGVVKLLGEASIGAGKRRVEGLVGADAYSYLAREHLLVAQLAGLLNVNSEDLVDRVQTVVARVRELEKELERVRGAAVLSGAGDLASAAVVVDGLAVVAHRTPDGTPADDLRKLALDVRNRLDTAAAGVVAVASVSDGRAVVVVAVNESGRERGLRAGDIAKAVAGQLGGGGGGKDDVAQGGGTAVDRLDDVLAALPADVAGRRW